MPNKAATWLLICGFMLVQTSAASERNYIKKNERFCDNEKELCIDGTIAYEPNTRILSLRARVQKQTGPGEIRLAFSGTNRQGSLKKPSRLSRASCSSSTTSPKGESRCFS